MTAYDFAETDQLEELRALGKKLQKAETAKDPLVKLLKSAGELLEAASQSKKPQEAAKDLAKGLQAPHTLHHKDKDVRAMLAFCHSQLFRLYAPESPFPEEILPEVFGVFLSVLKRLSDPHTPGFQACFRVFEVISQVKCYLLLLDMEDSDLLLKFVREIVHMVREDSEKVVAETCIEVLTGILEESEDQIQPLLDMVLEGLLPPVKDENPAQYRLSQAVLRRAEAQVQPVLQTMLSAIISGEPSDSVHKGDYHRLIFEVYQVCPQTLLPVLPRLAEELHADDAKQRAGAASLVGSLFSLPGSDLATSYADLFDALLKRLENREASVRLRTIEVCKKLLSCCECQDACAKTVAAMEHRVQDFADKVRAAATVALCEAAMAAPLMVPPKTLEAAAVRMKDKVLSVRKDAITAFATLFRTVATQAHDGVIPEQLEMLLWVPGSIAQACAASPELLGWAQETVLKAGLSPAKMASKDAAQLWGTVYGHATSKDKVAIMRLLKVQAAMRAELQGFLKCRDSTAEDGEARMDRACQRLAAAGFADPSKAKESLHKLAAMKDNNIFKSLAAALAPGTTPAAIMKSTKDALTRIGTKGTVGDIAKALCAWTMPTLLLPEHLKGLCSLAISQSGSNSSSLTHGVQELLADAASASPLLFVGLHESCTQLLEEDELTGARVLSHVGSHLRSHMGQADLAVFTKNVPPILKRLCSNGSPAAAKASTRALAHLSAPSEIPKVLSALCQQLVKDLPERLAGQPASLMPALQTLSMAGRICPVALGPHASALEAFIMGPLLMADLDEALMAARKTPVKQDGRTGKTWGHFSEGIKLKAFAIKALARGLSGDLSTSKPAQQILDVVDTVVPQLTPLLDIDADMSHLQPQGAVDEGLMRLSASSALLRIARVHDARIPNDVYFTLALTMQDQYMEVRQAFGSKLQRMMLTLYNQPATQHKAAKFAAMLSLAGMDPAEANQQAALLCLHQFTSFRRRAAKAAAAAASQQAAGGSYLHEHPEWVLPFTLQVLAHHPEFPQQEDLEAGAAEALEPFMKMLQFTLEPLLLPMPGSADTPGSSLALVNKLLRTLTRTEDATTYPATACIHLLSALGQQLAPAILAKHSKGRAHAADDAKLPGTVPLPAAFFRPLKQKLPDEERLTLPIDFAVEVNELFSAAEVVDKSPPRKQDKMISPGGSKEKPRAAQRKRKTTNGAGQKKAAGDGKRRCKPEPTSSSSIPSKGSDDDNDDDGDDTHEDPADSYAENDGANAKEPLRITSAAKSDRPSGKQRAGRPGRGLRVDKENATPEKARRAAADHAGAQPGRAVKAPKSAAPLPPERPSRRSSRSRGSHPPQYIPACSSDASEPSQMDNGDAGLRPFHAAPPAQLAAANPHRKAAKKHAASSPSAATEQPPGDDPAADDDATVGNACFHAQQEGQRGASASPEDELQHRQGRQGKKRVNEVQPAGNLPTSEAARDVVCAAQLRADTPCKPEVGAAMPAGKALKPAGKARKQTSNRQPSPEPAVIPDSDPYMLDTGDADQSNAPQANIMKQVRGQSGKAKLKQQSAHGSSKQGVQKGPALDHASTDEPAPVKRRGRPPKAQRKQETGQRDDGHVNIAKDAGKPVANGLAPEMVSPVKHNWRITARGNAGLLEPHEEEPVGRAGIKSPGKPRGSTRQAVVTNFMSNTPDMPARAASKGTGSRAGGASKKRALPVVSPPAMRGSERADLPRTAASEGSDGGSDGSDDEDEQQPAPKGRRLHHSKQPEQQNGKASKGRPKPVSQGQKGPTKADKAKNASSKAVDAQSARQNQPATRTTRSASDRGAPAKRGAKKNRST